MRVHSASVENAFFQDRRRARFTLPPQILPGPFGVVIDPGVGFAPLSSFLAQRVAVGKGGGHNFLRERSLAFSAPCNVADPHFAKGGRSVVVKSHFTSGQPPSLSGRKAWSAGTSASSL